MEFVREVNSKEWDAIRWAEVIPDRETKLSPEQSRKVIGELHNVMESCVHIEKLAPFLERRRILDLRQCRYFVSQNALDPDHEARKLNELIMKLQRAADIPEGGCVRSLYLSLCDVSEQDDLASAQQHRHVASYLRKQVQMLLDISEEGGVSVIESCVNGISENAVPFESAKADVLAHNLGIGSAGSNIESYKEVCKLWLNNKMGQCTLSQLLCALFKSGLARLACGLKPIYDSNQPEFKSFIQKSVRSQAEFRKVVEFFNFDHEGRSIERRFSGIIKSQADLLLRLILLPNCGDKIGDVITCLRECLNESKSQRTSGANQSGYGQQQSQCQTEVGSQASVSEDGLERDGVCSDASQSVQWKGFESRKTESDDAKHALRGGVKQCEDTSSKGLEASVSSSDMVLDVGHGHSSQQTGSEVVLDGNNQPNLLKECLDGEWDFVCCIVKTERNVDCLMVSLTEEDHEGKTALHHACMKEKIDCVKIMIEKGANLSHVDKSGNSVLHYPTVLKNEQLLSLIVDECVKKRISIDKPTKDDYLTPLMVACTLPEEESVKAAQLLLAHNASPDGHARAYSHPIIIACGRGNLKLIKLLVTCAVDINIQDKEGSTALLKACSESHWSGDVVKYLLGLDGINVNRSDKSGTTPLFAAVRANNQEITQLLLQENFNPRVNTSRMITSEPFSGQIEETPLTLACALGFLEIVKMLIGAGADPNYKCSGHVSALGFAILRRQNHIVSYLLTCPKLDKTITGLSAEICLSVRVENLTGTRLLMDHFGGHDKCLSLAGEHHLTDVQQHIHEYILTGGPESDAPENPRPFFERQAKVDDVIHLFTRFCMNIVERKMTFSQWAEVTEEINNEVSLFFKRCANGYERREMLKADFLGASKGVSPLSFLISQKALNTEDFLVEANAHFNNEPEVFYDTLIEAFHTIPGGEGLPFNITVVLGRLFSGSFSLNCQIGSSFGQLPPYLREHFGGHNMESLYRSESCLSPSIPSHGPPLQSRSSEYPAITPAESQPEVVSDSSKVATPTHSSESPAPQDQFNPTHIRSKSAESKSSIENVGQNINPTLHQYFTNSAASTSNNLFPPVQVTPVGQSSCILQVGMSSAVGLQGVDPPMSGVQRPYVKVKRVDNTKKHLLGGGAHGSVEVVVDSKGNYCAAKKIHQLEVDQELSDQVERIFKEITVLLNLNHKNIVRYIGLANLDRGDLPAIIMELMHTNLHKCIVKKCPPGPLDYSGKIKVMLGVCSGLDYLHKNNVIHRDLTARNVLLDILGNAKIADFGNCKILSKDQMSSMTANQGTLLYLAPECTRKTYTEMVDIFSYGHITLCVFTNEFPTTLLCYASEDEDGELVSRSEVERREQYIDKLVELMKPNTIIVSLVKQCLANSAKRRPSLMTIQQMLIDAQQKPPSNTEDHHVTPVRAIEQ